MSIYSNRESQAGIFNSELPELTTQHSGRPLLFRQGPHSAINDSPLASLSAAGADFHGFATSARNVAEVAKPGRCRLPALSRAMAVKDIESSSPWRMRSQSGYYPYGEAVASGGNDMDRFATYYRDGTTGLDYAGNRYYSSTMGRFMSADPYRNSAGLGDPGSWNRYAYVENDPVNLYDPEGLDSEGPPASGCSVTRRIRPENITHLERQEA